MVLPPGFSQYFVVRIVSPHLQWPVPCHGCLVEGEWMADQELNITEFLNGVLSSGLLDFLFFT